MPAQRESRLFLLDDNTVQELDHQRYMVLARGEAVVDETCSWLVFHAKGWLDPHAAHAIDAAAAPTATRWMQVCALVFGEAVPELS
jgi:hypothetical protein